MWRGIQSILWVHRTRLPSLMNPVYFLILFLTFSCAPLGAAGAEAPWTAEALVRRALEANVELRAWTAEVEAVRGDRTQAGLWKNPELAAEYGQRRTREPGEAREGSTVSLSITQTFEFPGKATLRKAIADHDVALAGLGLEQFRAALAGQVRLLAVRHSLAQAEAEAAGEIRQRCDDVLRLMRSKPTAGTAQWLELRVIEAGLIGLRRSARAAALELEDVRAELSRLLDLPQRQAWVIVPVVHPPRRPGVSLDALVLAGLRHNTQLRMRAAELEKASRQADAARLEAAPDFSVGPFFSQDRAGGTEENFGASVTVAVPLWNWNQGAAAAARARRGQAGALLQDARQRVEAEIVRRHRSFEACLREWEETPPDTVERLLAAADLADRHFRTGAVGAPLFLEVQREAIEAMRVRHETLRALWSDALDLELLCGGKLDGREAP